MSAILRTVTAARPAFPSLSRPVLLAVRHFADRATPGQSSNVSDTQASSPEGQDVLNSRATDGRKQQDTKSLHTPVSNPEGSGLGGPEEPTQSQDAMKRDPNEPDEQKRKKVLEFGQNKKLDPADQ